MAEKKTGTSLSTRQPLPWPLLFIFLFLTMAIAGAGYFYYKTQKQRVIKEQIAQLRAIADLKVAQIGNWLGERTADVSQASDEVETGKVKLGGFLLGVGHGFAF
ncbi:MAG: hypothetical protein MUP71_08370 [Candidatus Aminicenantes bacterium]|nr:hypothetical protein [Candidatus Aminicenantes bacterium]